MKFIVTILTCLYASFSHAAFWWEKVEVIDYLVNPTNPIRVPIDKELQSSPSPTIILAHGCSGINGQDYGWVKLLHKAGYNIIVPDSLSPRNVGTTCNRRAVTYEQRADDINTIAKWIKKQSWHNGPIIGIGFSHGAASVLEAGMSVNTPLSAVVAYYPWCKLSYKHVQIPSQIHIGALDTWTPSANCEAIKDYNTNQKVFIYDNAYHSFDRSYNTMSNGHALQFDQDAYEKSKELTLKFIKTFQ